MPVPHVMHRPQRTPHALRPSRNSGADSSSASSLPPTLSPYSRQTCFSPTAAETLRPSRVLSLATTRSASSISIAKASFKEAPVVALTVLERQQCNRTTFYNSGPSLIQSHPCGSISQSRRNQVVARSTPASESQDSASQFQPVNPSRTRAPTGSQPQLQPQRASSPPPASSSSWPEEQMDQQLDQDFLPSRKEEQETVTKYTAGPMAATRRQDPPQMLSPRQTLAEKVEECIQEGMGLLLEGRQGLAGSLEIGLAEALLGRAAEKFEEAYRLDPSCRIALGQSGNALLALGELKLKAARLLRAELRLNAIQQQQQVKKRGKREEEKDEDDDDFFVLKNARARDPEEEEEERRRREELEEAAEIVDVLGDECEEALVEAGRRYRSALSLDNSDARALYNWGLALCYRAQLVMDEADEEYEELADRMLKAAIDKFQAMMSLTDNWRPGALHNIGLALRDRSRLRPLRSQERLQLAKEAKGCLRDALRWDPTNLQLKTALSACSAELDKLQQLAEERQLAEGQGGGGAGGFPPSLPPRNTWRQDPRRREEDGSW